MRMKATIYKKIVKIASGKWETIYFDENGSFTDEAHALFCLIRYFDRDGRLKTDEWKRLKPFD